MRTRFTKSAADTMYRHGFTAHSVSPLRVAIERDGEISVALVKRYLNVPRPSDFEKDQASAHKDRLLYVLPRLTPRAIKLAEHHPTLILVGEDDCGLYLDGAVRYLRPQSVGSGSRGRLPRGRWAVMRALFAPTDPPTQNELAKATGLTQGAVSNALKALDNKVERRQNGWVATDPAGLWHSFMSSYPGVGGVRTHWYSLTPVVKQAVGLCALIQELQPTAQTLISGDVGADLIAPWRIPASSVIYSSEPVDLEALQLFASAPADGNLGYVIPEDNTVWHTAKHFGRKLAADPLIVAHEVLNAQRADSTEAAAHIKETTLSELREAQSD